MQKLENLNWNVIMQSTFGLIAFVFLSGLFGTLTWRIFEGSAEQAIMPATAAFPFYTIGFLELAAFAMIVVFATCLASGYANGREAK